MKKLISTLIFTLIIATASIFAFVPINNVSESNLTNWMSEVDDSYHVRELSIPGTHDSAATHSIADVAGKCQDLTIKEQLTIGVRFFDIRLQMYNNEFRLVHDFLDQKLSFDSVVNDFVSFLKQYPSEFLIVSIKKDYDDFNSSTSFETLFRSYFENNEEYISYMNYIPLTVEECRGKIHIIDRYGMDIGVPSYYWRDNDVFENDDLKVQDYYCIDNIEEKIKYISDTINYSKNNFDKLTLNFTSCYLDNGFPPLYAGTTAKYINPALKEMLKEENLKADHLGIMIIDYISSDLTSLIIGGNF